MRPPRTPDEAAGSEPKKFHLPALRWWIALLLMGVTVVNYLDRTCLSVAGPVLKSKLGINEVGFSRIVIAFQLTYLIALPLAGSLIDWLNLRLGLALAILFWSVAQIATALASGWRTFAALRALLGLGEAANFPGAAKAVEQWFPPRERTLATGVFNVGAGIGALIAPPFVVYLILRFNWQSAFVATGAIGVGWVVLWAWFYRSPDEHPWLSRSERAHILEGRASLAPFAPLHVGASQSVWFAVTSDRNFWAVAIARFLSEPAWQFFTYWIPLYLASERHMTLKEIGYFAWLPFLAADLGSLFGGALSPLFLRLGLSVFAARKASTSVCAGLMVFAVFIGTAKSAPWAIFFFCIAAFAHQAMSSTLLTLPADLFPPGAVATASGLSGSAAIFGGMLFTYAVGIVALAVGYGPLFIAIGLFDLVGSAVLWVLLREPRRAARAPGHQ